MIDNFSHTQVVRKTVIATEGGVVASQHKRAAQVGAAVLAAGGDAVDAAVATSFALGVVEPWMSGVAAGGCMVLWRADEQRARVVDYGMRSPRALDPADYPLTADGRSSDLFPWRAVVDDRNVQGATAVAVPGVVAGMALAHASYGRKPWRELVTPAVGLAEEGLLADWYSGLVIASAAKPLSQDPDAAAMFLDDGRWPIVGAWNGSADRHLDQKVLARSLRQIAEEGPRALYQGSLAQALVRDVRAKGGCLGEDDLAAYQAEWAEPLAVPYRGGTVYAAPGLTGGPTYAHALQMLERELGDPGGAPDAHAYRALARSLDAAFRARLSDMGDQDAPQAPGCTTHFSVVDRHGNLCAVTQTLLSIFGSRVVSPSTGVLLNNGIMWFDPEPGKPNSLAPGKRVLANYCPVVGVAADGRRFALGASGGRKILGAVLQLSSFLMAHGMSLEQAFHQPRIDVSGGGQVTADASLPREVFSALALELPTTAARRVVFPYAFACPAGVLRDGQRNMGCTEIMSPWGDAVHEANAP
ncbi:gamma-glutamyltransferase [Ramlibacter monticola]|uniref:Gamma-glutamyltransferase n=1 Tax=Ramlibacter monticola TaxID=1926872 RepID=A0A937CTS4_9BURK|nr:gamma-glutamyltransferase [Ramlibacter monticola]MBL0391864.1 gamma-glutamyltransferase [Ramlibacter monticola]